MKIFLNNIPQNSLLIIKYDCLKKNIPYIVGPKWKDFPNLDTLNIFEDSKEHFKKSSAPDTIQTIFSSGSFFRSLSLSPYGGSDFQGGVQMELNGKILENINISGNTMNTVYAITFHLGYKIITANTINSHNCSSFEAHTGDDNLLSHNDFEYPLNR